MKFCNLSEKRLMILKFKLKLNLKLICIDILNARSIEKEHLNVFITERFIEKTIPFWDSVKKFRRSH